ncbi:MAG: hypothetical protein COA71_03260 [SAR86 cluster bacterium]|uniref:phosphoglycolate phosphatase n=1 Tax=SAR86 cluster bacterium TaxID=2030880 RepID=A0A2A5CF75_9GAMM|nr:MAG: hypothetical protein COA71_03260 [SAR86 cluster bacterium]
MNRYDSIIFDLDGTLWNASSASAKGWNSGLASFGFNNIAISPQDMDAVSGKPFLECVEALLSKYSVSLDEKLINAMNAHEKVFIEGEGGDLYEGVIGGLKTLSKTCPLFLISNCQDWYLDAFWKHFSVKSYFQSSDCNGRAGVLKAEMIASMVNKYELNKPIYIGDTKGDEQASEAARVDFGFAEYGFGKAENPTVRFKSFRSIIDWLDE